MRPLSAGWPAIRQQVLSARHVLLCCDFDGTLAPIATHPSQARLPIDTQRLLEQLASLPGLRVALVSGRALPDLKRMVGVRSLYYIGNHGLELEGPNLHYVNPVAQATKPLLRRIAGELKAVLQPIPGAWIEAKGLTFSIHRRNVPKRAHRAFHRVVAQCTAPYLKPRAIQVSTGKEVIEIRPPVKWDKGTSIAWLLSRLRGSHGHSRPLVMYFGDDQTDEDAFRIVNRLRGFSVLVGRSIPQSAARYWLRDVRGVKAWLETLRQMRQRARMRGRRATHGLATACC